MMLPPRQYRKKKAPPYHWRPPLPANVPREFDVGLARLSGAQAGRATGIRDAVAFANRQAVNDSKAAFVVLDEASAGLARPLSAKQVMTDYGDAVKASLGQNITAVSLGRLHKFRSAATPQGGYVPLARGQRLVHFGDYRASLPPGVPRLRLT
jgi:hypothetical protein